MSEVIEETKCLLEAKMSYRASVCLTLDISGDREIEELLHSEQYDYAELETKEQIADLVCDRHLGSAVKIHRGMAMHYISEGGNWFAAPWYRDRLDRVISRRPKALRYHSGSLIQEMVFPVGLGFPEDSKKDHVSHRVWDDSKMGCTFYFDNKLDAQTFRHKAENKRRHNRQLLIIDGTMDFVDVGFHCLYNFRHEEWDHTGPKSQGQLKHQLFMEFCSDTTALSRDLEWEIGFPSLVDVSVRNLMKIHDVTEIEAHDGYGFHYTQVPF